MTLAEPILITGLIAKVFEKLKIPYFIGGSLASSLHGIPRATADVDIIADIKQYHAEPLVKALKSKFYIELSSIKRAIQLRSSFNVIHLTTMFKIDVFLLQPDPASKEEMARREKYQLPEPSRQELYLASAEDIILSKLRWYFQGGCVSERQWNDVKGVLQVQGDRLNYSYLKVVAKKRGISELLQKMLDDFIEGK